MFAKKVLKRNIQPWHLKLLFTMDTIVHIVVFKAQTVYIFPFCMVVFNTTLTKAND